MARVIAVASGKGGVGKTTTTVNLGTILAEWGNRVTVIDTNLTTPNLGIHFGIPLYPMTIHDVLRGDIDPQDAVFVSHNGLRIVPGSISVDNMVTPPVELEGVVKALGRESEIVLLDCAAGIGNEVREALKTADELVLVTQADLPSVIDALRTKKVADKYGVKTIGVVINRHGAAETMSGEEIADMLEAPVITYLPEDRAIQDSIAAKKPAVYHRPSSPASKAFMSVAAHLTGRHVETQSEGLIEKLLGWLRNF